MIGTSRLIFNSRLIALATACAVIIIFVILVGLTIWLDRIHTDYKEQHLQSLVNRIDVDLKRPDGIETISHWGARLLIESQLQEIELFAPSGKRLLHLQDTHAQSFSYQLESKHFYLHENKHFKVQLTLSSMSNQIKILSAFSVILLISLFFITLFVWIFHWSWQHISSLEQLEKRCIQILTGEYNEHATAKKTEWPPIASETIDFLVQRLLNSQEEKSQFDVFIRTHTFIDKITGVGNRILLHSKLSDLLEQKTSHGGVLLIQIDNWQHVKRHHSKQETDAFIVQLSKLLLHIIQSYPESVCARYAENQFVLLIAQQAISAIHRIADKLLKNLERIHPLQPLNIHDWFHIGVTHFNHGDSFHLIMEEAEIAMKNARYEEMSGWSAFEKSHSLSQNGDGNMSKRLFLDQFNYRDPWTIETHPCFIYDKNDDCKLDHYQLRLKTANQHGQMIPASQLFLMAENLGYQMTVERSAMRSIFNFLKSSDKPEYYSVHLCAPCFKDKAHFDWFRNELLQLPRETLKHLSFECIETEVIAIPGIMKNLSRLLHSLKSKLIIIQVGKTVTSIHYLHELKVTHVKIDPSLSKSVDSRLENQLSIRSIKGACLNTGVALLAVGVDQEKEWETLREIGVDGGQGRFFHRDPTEVKSKATLMRFTSAKTNRPKFRRNRWRKNG